MKTREGGGSCLLCLPRSSFKEDTRVCVHFGFQYRPEVALRSALDIYEGGKHVTSSVAFRSWLIRFFQAGVGWDVVLMKLYVGGWPCSSVIPSSYVRNVTPQTAT